MAKRAFHREGRAALRRLADAFGLEEDGYSLTERQGSEEKSGKIILHGEELWVRLSLDVVFPGQEVTYRRVRGRDDHWGEGQQSGFSHKGRTRDGVRVNRGQI